VGLPLSDLMVVIVTYRSAGYIEFCLSALLSQQDARTRVVIVDNASPDTTAAVLARYADHDQVSVLYNRRNIGFSAACNLAIRRYRQPGQNILLLNPDCVLPPGGLARLRDLVCQGAGIATLRLELTDGSLDTACARMAPNIKHSLQHALKLRRRSDTIGYHASAAYGERTVELEATVGALMFISAECADAVGLMDEDFWMYGEDLDYCLRARRAGFRILQAGSPTALHIKAGSTDGKRPPRINLEFHRALWLYYSKHLAAQDALAMRGAVLVGICLRALVSTGVGSLRQVRQNEPRPGNIPSNNRPGGIAA